MKEKLLKRALELHGNIPYTDIATKIAVRELVIELESDNLSKGRLQQITKMIHRGERYYEI